MLILCLSSITTEHAKGKPLYLLLALFLDLTTFPKEVSRFESSKRSDINESVR